MEPISQFCDLDVAVQTLWVKAQTANAHFSFIRVEGYPANDGVEGPLAIMQRSSIFSAMYGLQYGSFKREALLLSYATFSVADSWADVESYLSNGVEQQGQVLQRVKDAVISGNHAEITLLTARKVTGDLHVPSGTFTFWALIKPSIGLFVPQIETVQDRGASISQPPQRVKRSFPGAGTLAYPHFESPSWVHGQLVELEDEKLGFVFHEGSPARRQVDCSVLTPINVFM